MPHYFIDTLGGAVVRAAADGRALARSRAVAGSGARPPVRSAVAPPVPVALRLTAAGTPAPR
ncbi:hypothetical protein MRF4_12545 [Methylobacterium radiotolerans]|uniref:Uncharacterized protein n=1 Tax=Methylobacterium oryzae TaxID=334852 RepID=A0ABU7TMM1_9HYPH